MAENVGSLAWTVASLLYAVVYTLQQRNVLDAVTSIECPVTYECYVHNPESVFASLHPCALAQLCGPRCARSNLEGIDRECARRQACTTWRFRL